MNMTQPEIDKALAEIRANKTLKNSDFKRTNIPGIYGYLQANGLITPRAGGFWQCTDMEDRQLPSQRTKAAGTNQTTEGLRNVLLETIDGVLDGKVHAKDALVVSKLADNVIKTSMVELAAKKLGGSIPPVALTNVSKR